MSQRVSPAMAAIMVVVVIAIAAVAWYLMEGRSAAGSRQGEAPPGMPASVAAEFQKRAGGVTGPKGTTGPNASPTMAPPTGPPGQTVPIGPPGGVPIGPPGQGGQ